MASRLGASSLARERTSIARAHLHAAVHLRRTVRDLTASVHPRCQQVTLEGLCVSCAVGESSPQSPLKAESAQPAQGGAAAVAHEPRSEILRPFGARMTVTVHKGGPAGGDSRPRATVRAHASTPLVVAASAQQIHALLALADTLDTWAARAAHARFRPAAWRQRGQGWAAAGWAYSGAVALHTVRESRTLWLHWPTLARRRDTRRAYIAAYSARLDLLKRQRRREKASGKASAAAAGAAQQDGSAAETLEAASAALEALEAEARALLAPMRFASLRLPSPRNWCKGKCSHLTLLPVTAYPLSRSFRWRTSSSSAASPPHSSPRAAAGSPSPPPPPHLP